MKFCRTRTALISMTFAAACTPGTPPADSADTDAALFRDIRHADWLPDGSGFVVTLSGVDDGDIVVMNLDGRITQTIANTPDVELMADWGPADRGVAYARRDSDGDYSLWAVNFDATEGHRLVEPGFPAIFTRWSPDGNRLTFNSTGGDMMRQVYASEADGSNVQQLTNDTLGHSDYPSWSPDGTAIVFESNRSGSWETYRMRPDGTGVTQITHNGSSAPRLSPDGMRLAFHEFRNGTDFDIFLADGDGLNEISIVSGFGDQRLPEWSPDGSRLAYISNTGGHHDLFVFDVGTGETRQVSHQPAGEFFSVLQASGISAARTVYANAIAREKKPRVFRDAGTVAKHTQWMLSDGREEQAMLLLEIGLLEFAENQQLVTLRDSLTSQ